MKRFQHLLVVITLTFLVIVGLGLIQPQAAFAQVSTGQTGGNVQTGSNNPVGTTGGWSSACYESGTDSNGESFQVATIQGFQCVIANILSIAVTAIGLTGFVMFIIASFNYLLSGGNSKGIETSRKTFTFAVAGLVVALSSIIILRIIVGFTGVQGILNFHIPNSCDGLPAGTKCP